MTKNQIKFAIETLADVFTPEGDAVTVAQVDDKMDTEFPDWYATTSAGRFLCRDLCASRAIKRLPGWPLHG